jgi:hypothetical protein
MINGRAKFLILAAAVGTALVLSACAVTTGTNTNTAAVINTNTGNANLNTNLNANTSVNSNSNVNSNTNSSVNTNQSTSNNPVLTGNICNVFTSDYVTSILGMSIVKSEAKTDTGVTACLYYTSTATDNQKFVEIAVEDFNVANVKQGYAQVGAATKTDPRLGADDFIGLRTDNTVRGIYLVMNPNKVVTVSSDAASTQPVSDDKLIQFAAQLKARLADYQ